MTILLYDAYHKVVNVRTIRFHNVICKAICIVAIVMVNSQGGQQSACDQSTSNDCSKDSIAIVQQIVWWFTFASTNEVWMVGEDVLPIYSNIAKTKRASYQLYSCAKEKLNEEG